jgi:hypothetical protein
MTELENELEKKPGDIEEKAPYHSPKMVVYGNIQEVTLTAQKAMNSDNPGMDMNMTG